MEMPARGNGRIPAGPEDIDADWVTATLGLGCAEVVSATPIGAGNAASTVRLSVQWVDRSIQPEQFVVKVAASNPDKRRAAVAWGIYEIEAEFYRSLASELCADIPRCYWAGYDPETSCYAVVLEDLGALTTGDDIEGITAPMAHRALAELAGVHGPRWNDPALAQIGWLNRYPRGQRGLLREEMTAAADLVDTHFADDLSPEARSTVRSFADASDRYDRKGFGGARTITHCDFRGENLMFGPDRVCIVDWQTVQLAAGLADVAYLLAASLPTDQRRLHEEDLVRAYHERLQTFGVALSWDSCWREYRRHGLCMLTTTLKVVAKWAGKPGFDSRARLLVQTLVGRAACQAADLESIALLPE